VGLDDADDNTAASPRLHLAAEAAEVAEAAEAAALQAAHSVSVDAAATVAQVEAKVRAKVEAEAAQTMADAEVLSRELEAAAIQHALNFSNIGAPGLAAGSGTGGAGGASVATANADGYFASGNADLKGENYDTVLGLLKECEEARKAERKRVDEAERDAQEGKTVHELALQELQLANLELRKKLRRLESESSHAPAFELYEAEISSLASKLQTSRTECAELEAMCREAQVAYAAARDAARLASGEHWPTGISETKEAKLSRVKNWRRALTSSDKELERLRQESAENAKKLRQGEVHKKSAEESTKRLHKMAKEYEKACAELTSLRLLASEAENQHRAMNAQIDLAQQETADARAALTGHEGVLASLREQIAGLQYERRKDAVVMRMAPRLQSSAEKLRKHLLGRSHGRAAGRSGGMPGQSTAGELIAALEKELQMMGKSPKAMIIVGRAKASVDSLEQARREGAEREDELLQLLVENLAPINEDGGLTVGGGGPGASPPNMQSSVGNAILVPADGRPSGSPLRGSTAAAIMRRPPARG